MIKALALDQAPTHSGWAVGSPDSRPPAFGHWRLRPWGTEEGERLVEFEDRMMGLIDRYAVTHVFFEALYPIITPRDFAVRENQAKVVGSIESKCARLKIPYCKVIIADWRMRFIGRTKPLPGLKGDAGRQDLKQAAIVACAKRGWYVDNPDAAEACGILNFGLSTLDPTYERRDQPLMRRAQSEADEARRAGI